MNSLILICLISLSAIACTAKQGERSVASVNAHQPAVEQGEVWGGDEAAMMDTVAQIFHDTLIESTGDDQIMRRDAHPKHHGCVASELSINNKNLPQDLRVGLFKDNHKYQGIVRFSNGDPNFRKADAEKDVRGLALKLIGVPYQNYRCRRWTKCT